MCKHSTLPVDSPAAHFEPTVRALRTCSDVDVHQKLIKRQQAERSLRQATSSQYIQNGLATLRAASLPLEPTPVYCFCQFCPRYRT